MERSESHTMLESVKLFRRHNDRCNAKNAPRLREDVLDKCDCNIGYKGRDKATRTFRRLMFVPPVKEVREAWRSLDQMEQGKPPAVRGEAAESLRLPIGDGFDRYLDIVRQRNVKESTIYSMFRPVGNAIKRTAEAKALKYIDELPGEFGMDVMAGFQHLSLNVRGDYRRNLKDFFRVARANDWIHLDLASRIDEPARGKRRTRPLDPTEPFDLTTELPRIMDAIPHLKLDVRYKRRNSSPWRDHVPTAQAFLYLLRYTGLRISDALLFEGQSLERRTVRDKQGSEREVYVRWVRKQKKTDAPVFVIIPLEVGEFIRSAPPLSGTHTFCPAGKSTGRQFHSWVAATSAVIFPALEKESGVRHVHAHRFRDTFAVELWKKTKDINYVSRALGHASVVVTMNHYSHFLQDDQDEAIKTMLAGWDGVGN